MPAARRDTVECFAHIGSDNPRPRSVFLKAARETFEDLARAPAMGVVCPFRGVRRWRIQRFESYLVFYRDTGRAIEIIRVVHGARNIERLFEEP
ncbi:MAG TPA: type II toxin-antitoxin system RelE/ParE family toxin [Bryobacteraceae bacterium]|nr:type II toxin-antitoxin system RelE/ParE family toxin [Bryobacteraceae bacterium]